MSDAGNIPPNYLGNARKPIQNKGKQKKCGKNENNVDEVHVFRFCFPITKRKRPAMLAPKTINQNHMKKTLSTYEAADYLCQDENANWSRAGAFALVEYLEEWEEDTGEEIEMDVVAIRCDYSEFSSLEDWAHDYLSNAWEELGFDESEEIDEDEFQEAIRQYIQNNGQLIEFSGGIIVSSF